MADVPADSYLSSPPVALSSSSPAAPPIVPADSYLSSSPASPPMSSVADARVQDNTNPCGSIDNDVVGDGVPADSYLSSSSAALSSSPAAAPPMSSVADARVQGNTNPCGSIDNDVVGDGVKEGVKVAGVATETGRRSFVKPSLSVSAKELPLPSSSTAPLCGGGGASSTSSSNVLRAPAQALISPADNAFRAPAGAPISPTAPPLHHHQRSEWFQPSHTGAIFRRDHNTYNSQQSGNYQSWSAPPPPVICPSPGSYAWHNPQRPGHNLYTEMMAPLPSLLPGLGQPPFIPRPTSAWVPPRAQAQPPITTMGYNGIVPATYNAQFVPHLDTYQMPFNNFQRDPLSFDSTYQMPFNNFQRAPVASTIRIRPLVDNQQLKGQIEYYFSVDNLCKDTFLRSKMDDQGWVPVSLIATFNRVKRVTTSTTEILNALRGSTVIEIQAEKIRRRKDWMRWLLPPSTRNPNGHSSMPQLTSNHDDSVIHPLGMED